MPATVKHRHMPRPTADGRVEQLSREEGRRMFDEAVQHYLHMSGEDFIRKYDAGEFDDTADTSAVIHLAMLRHFAE